MYNLSEFLSIKSQLNAVLAYNKILQCENAKFRKALGIKKRKGYKSDILKLIAEGKTNKYEIARIVGCSETYVRDVFKQIKE